MNFFGLILTTAALAVSSFGAVTAALNQEQTDFFEKKVRPILAENCYKCHSAEQGKSKGGLTLDSRDGVLKGGETGPALEPGAPEKSLLVHAIGYDDPDLQMPPKGEKLTKEQVETLTAWVKMGAPDPRTAAVAVTRMSGDTETSRAHWAFQPVVKPTIPVPQNRAWCRTPVDAFVAKGLEDKGMAPNSLATKETLLRRASYDLIGLPPTPEQLTAFVADESPRAFEKVVDRLLASPQYGERWGRHWLDTARYADTTGEPRGKDEYRYPHAWTYRDYVIQSFNEDKPYDQFILEQLAADQLPGEDPARLAALGFLTVGQRFRSVNDVINDRIDAVTKGFLGLTVSCARCHDHMFDPVPTEDYYSLHGIFASSIEPVSKPLLASVQESPELREFEMKMAALQKQNRDIFVREVIGDLNEFLSKPKAYLLAGRVGQRKGATAEMIAERNRIIRERKLEVDLIPSIFQRTMGPKNRNDSVFWPWQEAQKLSETNFEQEARQLADRAAKGRRALNPYVVKAFIGATPRTLEEFAGVYAQMYAGLEEQTKALIEAVRTSPERAAEFDPALLEVLSVPLELPTTANLDSTRIRELIQRWPNRKVARAGLVFNQINELQLTHPGAPAHAMTLVDAPRARDSRVFIRGEAENRGAVVPRRFLEILAGPERPVFKQGSGRLELAQAIASKDNPLTARVMVNRIWMHHFGEGLVTTPDDLGVQSAAPSNQALLDYLAAQFMEGNWSIKRLHRIIMLSSVYQQTTATNKAYEQKDPENRLLWRANIRRLDFEAVRDSLLFVSGKLDTTSGGKPVNLTDEPYSYRRSVYGYIDRGNLPELMSHFDFSDPDMPNSKRTTTVVPQQALFLMNSSMSVDVARKLVTRPEFASAYDDRARVQALYAMLFQRTARPEEQQMAIGFLNEKVAETHEDDDEAELSKPMRGKKRFAARREQRKQDRYGSQSIKNTGVLVDRKPLTAWERYAQALLFTNELAYVN